MSQNNGGLPKNLSNLAEVNSNGDIAGSLDHFANRLKRKLKEQEDKDYEKKRLASSRHALMLNAISVCRKALQEATKIPISEKASLEIDIAEFDGWPRIDLVLVHTKNPENRDCALIVAANDRNESGNVYFTLRSGENLGGVLLRDEEELQKLPGIIRKATRRFFTVISEVLLAQERSSDHYEEPIKAPDFDQSPANGPDLGDVSVFSEGSAVNSGSSNLVESVKSVEAIQIK